MGMIGNTLAQGLISGANIVDGTVDTPDIKDSAVTAAKIATGVVTPGKLSTGAPSWDSAGAFSAQGVQVSGSPPLTYSAGKWMVQYEGSGITRSYACGVDTSTYGSWEHYVAKSNGSPVIGFKVNNSGQFGLGTTTPSYQLDVWGFSASAGNQDVLRLYNQAGSTAAVSMVFHTGSNNVTAAIRNRTVSTHAAALVFETNNGSGLAERMLINSGGSVTMKDNLEVGNTGSSDTGLYVNYINTADDGYGRIRFRGGTANANDHTIHAFGRTWNSDLWTLSTGALNLNGYNGVTIGVWNDPTLVANNSGEVRVKTTLKVAGAPVLTNAATNVSVITSDYTFSANTWVKLAQMPTGAGGLYLLYICPSSSDFTTPGGSTIMWGAQWTAVVPVNGGNIYNAGYQETINVNSMFHFRTVSQPSFVMDSDNAVNASYGNQSIYVNFPQDTKIVGGMSVFVKKIF